MRLLKKGAALGLLALVGLTTACEDFLNTPPQGALDELTLSNAAGVEATLIGAYRMLGGNPNGWTGGPSNWAYGSVPSDDAYKGSEASDQPDANFIETYTWGNAGAHNYLNGKWSAAYEGVSRANNTLRLLDRVLAEKPGEIADATANSIRGEALFLRAFYHFEAWRMWGNVPYYTEADEDFRKPNAGADPIPMILADLQQAATLLPDAPRNDQPGRASSWTAKAYMGRVQVHSGDYAGGRATLQDVVDNGPYALEDNFHQVWTGFSEFANGPETIVAFQASVNDGDGDGGNSNTSERLNFPHSGSPLGCCGFHQPSQNLVNFYKVDGNGLPLALANGNTPLDATESWNADDDNFTADDAAPVDPRLDWTVGRDGVPYKDWGVHSSTLGWVRDISFGGFYNGKKHVHEKSSGAGSNVGWNPAHLISVNSRLFRYADLLLLLAEAEVEAGSLERAREIVNMIRERAGKVAQGPGTGAGDIAVPIDDSSITWANYSVGTYDTPWTDQAAARTAVRYERRLELAMEGQRFFDLRRWDEHIPVLNAYVAVEETRRPHLTAAVELTDRHDWYPIPNRQIELSEVEGESRLTQNPGW